MAETVISSENLKLLRNGRDLFAGLGDLKLVRGQKMLLLGPSGCGKTSLLHVLTALLPFESGQVAFKGKPYSRMSARELDVLRGHHFGIILQKLHLIPHLSVYQNIALAFSGSHRRPHRAGILALLKELELDGHAGSRAESLSQGEAQRVAIARAVAHGPDVIFADEPTSALDDRNAESVYKLLTGLSEKTGACLLISTHDSRLRDLFDGEIKEMGQ